MNARLHTKLWVDALIRRAEIDGAAAFVLHKGDAERGDVLIKVATMDANARALVPRVDMDGARKFVDLASQSVGPDEASVDAYIKRATGYDNDLWVIEIEDKAGRHFLTEPVEGETDQLDQPPIEDPFGGRLR